MKPRLSQKSPQEKASLPLTCKLGRIRTRPKDRRVESNIEGEDQPRGTITQRVPNLEREVDLMKIAMREMRDSIIGRTDIDDHPQN